MNHLSRSMQAVALALVFLGLGAAGAGAQQQEEAALERPPGALEDFEVVWQTIWQEYADAEFNGVDWQGLKDIYRSRIELAEDEEARYELLAEMVGQLEDGYTFIVPPDVRQSREGFQPEVEYAGIGIRIFELPEGDVVVVQVFPDSPAQAAGLLALDLIVSVDGWEVRGQGIEAVSERIRGPVGTQVSLVLRSPEGEERSVTVTRGRIDLRPVVSARIFTGRIGYIQIPGFTPSLMEQALRYMDQLVGTRGLILDLRGVSVGGPQEIAQVASWFVGSANLGAFVTRSGREPLAPAPEVDIDYRRPVAVLISGATDGAGAMVAAILQAHGRARLVGGPTSGPLARFKSVDLPSGGLLHLTDGYYVTPQGVLIGEDGVAPDVLVEPTLADVRGGRDPVLERAQELLQ